MTALVILLVLAICSTFTEQRNLSIENRIIGGQVAKEGQFPFAALIELHTPGRIDLCGGALITNQWILTAAHCIIGKFSATVHLGSISLTSANPNRIIINSSEMVPHPEFNRATAANDIGLIRLPIAVESTEFIQPIRLPLINLPTSLKATALGWGSTSDGSISRNLNYVTLSVISNNVCRYVYGLPVLDTMVCLIGTTFKGTCPGDSGNPIVLRQMGSTQMVHVGVNSINVRHECAFTSPTGFTRTFPYVGWIQSVIA